MFRAKAGWVDPVATFVTTKTAGVRGALAVSLALFGSIAAAQPMPTELEFKGFVVGDTLTSFKQRFPGFCEAFPDGRESCYFSARMCGDARNNSSMCQRRSHPITEFAATNASEISVIVNDNKVDIISISVGVAQYETVTAAIEAKYGPMTRSAEYKLYGQPTQYEILRKKIWEVAGGEIVIYPKHLRIPTLMTVSYVSPAFIKRLSADEAARADAARKQL